MPNHNLDLLLEKSNQVSLGIRARQTGISLKEYFLTQQERAKNIIKSQKNKLNEAIEQASLISNDSLKKSSTHISVYITNKAGKDERKVLCNAGTTAPKIFKTLKKIAVELYGIIKYRTSQILKYSTQGIKLAKLIVKGKANRIELDQANGLKQFVSEYVALLNTALAEMRDLFKAFRQALK